MNVLLILLIYSNLALSDDGPKSLAGFDPKTDLIAHNYEAGAYLIYDCQEKHWVCVLESYYLECQKQRQLDNMSKSDFHLCAPIEAFPTKKSCFQRQLFLTTQNHGTRFCIKDQWKSKN